MRLIAWNLGHQTQERRINAGFDEVISKLAPDVLTLNEYVDGSTRKPLRDHLERLGLDHIAVSDRITTNNQVLIASRYPFTTGDLVGPYTEDGGGPSNFLHIALAEPDMEIVGVRVPAYLKRSDLQDYWAKFAALVRSTAKRKIIFAGDLDADPDVPGHCGSATLSALRTEGWNLPTPSGAWSFASGSRIDHVLGAPGAFRLSASYVSDLDGIALASRDTANRISDHAALVVEVDV